MSTEEAKTDAELNAILGEVEDEPQLATKLMLGLAFETMQLTKKINTLTTKIEKIQDFVNMPKDATTTMDTTADNNNATSTWANPDCDCLICEYKRSPSDLEKKGILLLPLTEYLQSDYFKKTCEKKSLTEEQVKKHRNALETFIKIADPITPMVKISLNPEDDNAEIEIIIEKSKKEIYSNKPKNNC